MEAVEGGRGRMPVCEAGLPLASCLGTGMVWVTLTNERGAEMTYNKNLGSSDSRRVAVRGFILCLEAWSRAYSCDELGGRVSDNPIGNARRLTASIDRNIHVPSTREGQNVYRHIPS